MWSRPYHSRSYLDNLLIISCCTFRILDNRWRIGVECSCIANRPVLSLVDDMLCKCKLQFSKFLHSTTGFSRWFFADQRHLRKWGQPLKLENGSFIRKFPFRGRSRLCSSLIGKGESLARSDGFSKTKKPVPITGLGSPPWPGLPFNPFFFKLKFATKEHRVGLHILSLWPLC